MRRDPRLTVRDTALDPETKTKVILYRKAGQRFLYKVRLYLDGPDLPYVSGAEYRLHPTFPNPVRTLTRSSGNPNCSLVIWTWGIFVVTVKVFMKNGDAHVLTHKLTYDAQMEEEGVEFIEA